MSAVRRCTWPIRDAGSIGRGARLAGTMLPEVVAYAITCYMSGMKLTGLHHITMITGDAQRNVAFYADILGLRFVKKTVNFDAPEAYHLYFGDETGHPRIDPDLVRVPRRRRRPRGHGPDPHASARRADRRLARLLGAAPARARRATATTLRFEDPDGLRLELVVASRQRAAAAAHPEIPAEHAISGLEGARAYSRAPPRRGALLTDVLGFTYGRRRVPPRRAPSATSAGPTTRRRSSAARRAPAPSTTSRGARRTTTSSRGRSASRGRRLRHRRQRPRLLPVDLLPGAARRAVRDRHADPRASPSTRTPTTSARRCASQAARAPARPARAYAAARRQPASAPPGGRYEPPHLPRAPGGRGGRRARWSSTTAAAPTRTTCSGSPTCSTPSAGCTSSPRARRCRSPAGRATTGTSCRASATPTTTPSTRLRAARRPARRAVGAHRADARADRVRRLLDGLGDELLARPRPGPPGARRHPRLLGLRPDRRRLAAVVRRPRRTRACSSRTGGKTRSWTWRSRAGPRADRGRRPAVEYHESDAGHHIDPAHVPRRRRLAADYAVLVDLDAVRTELEARRDSIRGRVDTLAERPSSAPRRASASASATAPRRRSAGSTDIGVGRSLETGLERIDRALAKLDEGTYGTCDSCGDAIPEKRLAAMPESTLCVNCAAAERRVPAPRR